MGKSQDDVAAEWLRLWKEYARWECQAKQIEQVTGKKKLEFAETGASITGAIDKDGIYHPTRIKNPASFLIAYHEYTKVRHEQAKINEEMRHVEIEAIRLGFALPKIAVMQLAAGNSSTQTVLVVDGSLEEVNTEIRTSPHESPRSQGVPNVVTSGKHLTGPERTTVPRKSSQKVNKPTAAERHIIKAINDGLAGAAFCRRLDINELPPRVGWLSLRPPKPVWPRTYQQAYCHGTAMERRFWRKRIQDYKNDIKRKFNL
jgi:hypothetical protein